MDDMSLTVAESDPIEDAAPVASRASEGVTPGDFLAFVSDTATTGLLGKLASALRLRPQVHGGGIAMAIECAALYGPARLLLVDLSDSDDPMRDIDALADVCDPVTKVIAIGTVNDVTLYRNLARAGISDYLIKPLDGPAFAEAIEAVLLENEEAPSSAQDTARVIGFVGARGGVGTSTTALATATDIMSLTSSRISLVDLDLAFGSLNLALDLEPVRGLKEALDAPERIDAMFLSQASSHWADRLAIFASEEDPSMSAEMNLAAIGQLIAAMRGEFSHIVIDMPRHLLTAHPGLFGLLTDLVIVSDLSLAGLRDANRLHGLARDLIDDKHICFVTNRVGANRKAELGPRDFAKPLNGPVIAEIPDMPKVAAKAVQDALPFQIAGKGTRIAAEIDKIAGRFVMETGTPKGRKLFRKAGRK